MKINSLGRFRTLSLSLVGLLLLSFGFLRLLQAQELCVDFGKAQDILYCIQKRNAELQLSQVEIAIAYNSEAIAKQRPNPELDSRTLGGFNSEDFLSEINFGHTVELGGKRQSRINQAKALQQAAEVDLKSTEQGVILESVLALYRLRQIEDKKTVLIESATSLHHIQGLYQKRSLLDAEQQASKSVFALLKRDIQLQQASLLEEEWRLKNFLEQAAGTKINWSHRLLPQTPKPWPSFKNLVAQDFSQGIEIQKAKSQLDYAKTSLKRAQSDAKPNLKLGPSVETRIDEGNAGVGLGLNLAIPLNLYHRNQGQKQEAILKQKKAELNLALTQKQKTLETKQLLETYSNLVKLLHASQSFDTTASHQEIDNLFERGFIPSALVIETHRQLIESKEKYHELELKALAALWRLYALQGLHWEEKI